MDKKEGEKTSSSARDVAAAKKLLVESLVKKAEYYCSKDLVTDTDLYYLVKDFFRAFLELKYEFSFDELLAEIDKTYMETQYRERTIAFIRRIERIEYANAALTDENINALVKEFSLLSRGLLNMAEPKKKSFWNKVGGFFVKDEPVSGTTKATIDAKQPAATKESVERRTQLDVMADDDFSSTKEKMPAEENDSLTELKEEYTATPAPATKTASAQQATTANENPLKAPSPNSGKKYYSAEPDVYTKYYNTKSRTPETQTTDTYDWLTPGETNSAGKKDARTSSKQAAQTSRPAATKTSVPKETAMKTSIKANPSSKDNNKEPKKDDIDSMISAAKKLKKKSELIALYKNIHSIYEKGDVELQTKYYQDIMDIYKSISKLK